MGCPISKASPSLGRNVVPGSTKFVRLDEIRPEDEMILEDLERIYDRVKLVQPHPSSQWKLFSSTVETALSQLQSIMEENSSNVDQPRKNTDSKDRDLMDKIANLLEKRKEITEKTESEGLLDNPSQSNFLKTLIMDHEELFKDPLFIPKARNGLEESGFTKEMIDQEIHSVVANTFEKAQMLLQFWVHLIRSELLVEESQAFSFFRSFQIEDHTFTQMERVISEIFHRECDQITENQPQCLKDVTRKLFWVYWMLSLLSSHLTVQSRWISMPKFLFRSDPF